MKKKWSFNENFEQSSFFLNQKIMFKKLRITHNNSIEELRERPWNNALIRKTKTELWNLNSIRGITFANKLHQLLQLVNLSQTKEGLCKEVRRKAG